MDPVQYVRLYADEQGESHFEDVQVSMTTTGFAPPAPPLDISEFVGARRFAFLRAPAGWFGDWHPAPARQFLVVLEGEFEVSASDGETRRFGAGSVLLVEDTTGKGHMTRALGEAEASTAVVQI
jgi:hypothetical protein